MEELRAAFRRRARELHPDVGGTPEAFRSLREAYATLRRRGGAAVRGGQGPSSEREARKLRAKWDAWEEEVRQCRVWAEEDNVLYWREDEEGAVWQPAVVLAVQVVEEPSSGPHGWIYLQPLVPDEEDAGAWREDLDADMEQVEPLSPDGVNWCFAPSLEPLPEEHAEGGRRWRFGPPPPLWLHAASAD